MYVFEYIPRMSVSSRTGRENRGTMCICMNKWSRKMHTRAVESGQARVRVLRESLIKILIGHSTRFNQIIIVGLSLLVNVIIILFDILSI